MSVQLISSIYLLILSICLLILSICVRRIENNTSFKSSYEWLICASLLNYAKYFKITIILEIAVNPSSYIARKHHMPIPHKQSFGNSKLNV